MRNRKIREWMRSEDAISSVAVPTAAFSLAAAIVTMLVLDCQYPEAGLKALPKLPRYIALFTVFGGLFLMAAGFIITQLILRTVEVRPNNTPDEQTQLLPGEHSLFQPAVDTPRPLAATPSRFCMECGKDRMDRTLEK